MTTTIRRALLGLLTTGLAVGVLVGAQIGPAAAAPAPSGTLRLAAQEELYCADWIASCAGLSWGSWTLGVQTLPQAFQVTAAGDYVPGPVLAGEPVLSVGPPMTVTYQIAPAAVWNDGVPVTSADFAYTWNQIVTGKDIYDASGYNQISAIDTSDPARAVATFSAPYAGWRDLFSGFSYILPSHILEGKDRHREMKDGYAFSAGPWQLDGGKSGWRKGRSLTLVPNPKWWGQPASIAKVVFQFIPDSAAEAQALKTRQVLAGYPQPQTGLLDQMKAAGLTTIVGFGNAYEGLWLNESAWPLDDPAVRRALLYASDRQVIVDQIVKPSVGDSRVLQSFIMPTFPKLFVPAFAEYPPSRSKVDALMTGAGWTRGKGGIWEKGGRRAELEALTTAGNKNRELTLQIWQSQLQAAGFALTPRYAGADVLFGKNVPKGQFTIALYTSVGTPDPGLCVIFCSQNIPTKANGYVGQNATRTRSAEVDRVWGAVDRELDVDARTALVKQGQEILANEVVSIPLFQQPDIFVYDGSRIGGPLEDNTVMGPFWNMERWTLK